MSSLDVKLVVSLWKAVSRLSGRHKHLLKDGLDVDAMVTYLCTEISKGYEYLLQLAPPSEEDSQELVSCIQIWYVRTSMKSNQDVMYTFSTLILYIQQCLQLFSCFMLNIVTRLLITRKRMFIQKFTFDFIALVN